jgi:hypothetical protein
MMVKCAWVSGWVWAANEVLERVGGCMNTAR